LDLLRHAGGGDDSWRISMPASPSGATWTPAPRVVDRLHYRQDQRGFMERGFVHLFVVPADGGTARQLTHGAWHVGARFDGLAQGAGYDWMPDGPRDHLRRAARFDVDWNYRNSHLYSVDVASGEVRQLTTRPGTWTNPAVSPDGRNLAFVGVRFRPLQLTGPAPST